MKRILHIVTICLLVTLPLSVVARQKKKEKTVAKQETPYQKFFAGKKCITRDGFVRLHRMENKVYMEFPLRLLGKSFLLTSSIEDISDNGEGVVGQFAGRGLHLKFRIVDSLLQVGFVSNAIYDDKRQANLTRALEESHLEGAYKSFKIEMKTPDKDAVLVDVTSLFLENSMYTNPFTTFGGNSLFGFVVRVHNFKPERSFLRDIDVRENEIVVQCEMGFGVDRLIFGRYAMATDAPVSLTVNKMLLLLPDEPMRPRLADSRIGVMPVRKVDFSKANKGPQTLFLAKRWRIEPADKAMYARGELVEPRKPIVFYLDTLMPEAWKPYVREGVQAWNQAFEQIGFKNAVRVQDFPKHDPNFDANDIQHSTIRYSPSVLWMTNIQTSMHEDPRTGEILNASLYIHNNIMHSIYSNRCVETMNADPAVRTLSFSEKMTGEMLKVHVMQAVGSCLGLTRNLGASYAYPVDSLRSVTFTRQYGLSPSVMDGLACNYIAQPEDVKKGVRMVPKGLGAYDFYAIKWLYKPIDEVEFQNERKVLDAWIREGLQNPYCRYAKAMVRYPAYDPSIVVGDLGNDPLKGFDYLVKNLKSALASYYDWYAVGDGDMQERVDLLQYFDNLFTSKIREVSSVIGGGYLRDVKMGDGVPPYEMVPQAKQQAVLHYLVDLAKDLSWWDNTKAVKEMEIIESKQEAFRDMIVSCLFDRMSAVTLWEEKSAQAYTLKEYLRDLNQWVWEGTLKNRMLTPDEISLQRMFLNHVIQASTVEAGATVFGADANAFVRREYSPLLVEFSKKSLDCLMRKSIDAEYSGFYPAQTILQNPYPMSAIYYDMLLDLQTLLKSKVAASKGETKKHYDYLLFRIRKSLSVK